MLFKSAAKEEAMKKGLALGMVIGGMVWNLPAFSAPNQTSEAYLQSVQQYMSEENQKSSFSKTSLYERSLVGMARIFLGDIEGARVLLESCLTDSRESEERLAGPQLWVALFALQYERITDERRYHSDAVEICKWYLALPRAQGLPAISNTNSDGVFWTQTVSLEDARLGTAVLRLASALSANAELKEKMEIEAANLEGEIQKWNQIPDGSFLLMASAPGALHKSFRLEKGIYLVANPELQAAQNAESVSEMLRSYWSRLSHQSLTDEEKAARYEITRRLAQSAENLLLWREENNLKVYDVSSTALLYGREEWYFPEGKKRARAAGVIPVCFDLFRGRWDLFSVASAAVNIAPASTSCRGKACLAPTSVQSQTPDALFEMARIYLLAGETEKAEKWAQACVDDPQAQANPAYADAVGSAWMILGKIQHDRSATASTKLMLTSADHYRSRRDVALNKIKTNYPTASVTAQNGVIRSVVQIIREMYN